MKAVETLLVLGATGGIGGEITRAALRRGWTVKALVRDPARADAAWPAGGPRPLWLCGDVMQREDVVKAAAGVQAIVHAVNPPGYQNWEQLALPMLENTIAAARAAGGARIALPGTIYNFDPATTPVLDEHSPSNPRGRKGAVRVRMEALLEQAAPAVPSLILRAGDFFGPNTGGNWFAQAMVTPNKPVTRLIHPGKGVGHSWAYLPDLAESFVQLLDRHHALRPFERLQFEGLWDVDGTVLTHAIRRVVGRSVREYPFPWWLMKLARPFNGFAREAMEIQRFWQHPVRMDNSRLLALLGHEPRTPIDVALASTLTAMGCLCPTTSEVIGKPESV